MRELIYGRNAVHEVLRAHRREVYKLLVAEGAQERGVLAEALALAAQRNIPIQRVPRSRLDHVTDAHQGIAAEAGPYPYVNVEDILDLAAGRNEPPLILVLDVIQNPQNLGTLLRTAEAMGVHGAILPQRRGVEVTLAVVNASSGASEHLRIARVVNLVRSMEELKELGVWIAGLEHKDERAIDFWSADLRGPLALVVGNEAEGMRRLVRQTCDYLLRIPMRGHIESLNASIAGSIVLYEVFRQRRAATQTVAQ
ncbi:MAG TPA: 23S rRNA (guanosine(2251)-2'-O)-methyltransferase RlmB [Anaerolineae bacterium]|nr:23S rRNA (guanosine(2251)-2'-O)-methyltransferase RlmB [Anaerolineae bacterium]